MSGYGQGCWPRPKLVVAVDFEEVLFGGELCRCAQRTACLDSASAKSSSFGGGGRRIAAFNIIGRGQDTCMHASEHLGHVVAQALGGLKAMR